MYIINDSYTYNLYILYYNISVLKSRYCYLQTLIYMLRYHVFKHILETNAHSAIDGLGCFCLFYYGEHRAFRFRMYI